MGILDPRTGYLLSRNKLINQAYFTTRGPDTVTVDSGTHIRLDMYKGLLIFWFRKYDISNPNLSRTICCLEMGRSSFDNSWGPLHMVRLSLFFWLSKYLTSFSVWGFKHLSVALLSKAQHFYFCTIYQNSIINGHKLGLSCARHDVCFLFEITWWQFTDFVY